jgi:hypothetical protein
MGIIHILCSCYMLFVHCGSVPYFCHPRGRLLVDVLLELALVVADIAGSLLLAVAGDGADDSVLLADETVGGALGVTLGLCGADLSLAGGVLLLAGVGPGGGAGDVADLEGKEGGD